MVNLTFFQQLSYRLALVFLIALFLLGIFEPLISWGKFGPLYIDISSINGTAPSFSGDHWLGTDLVGRDVLKGLMSGSKVTVYVMLLTSVFTLIIALLVSVLTSYVGNDALRMGWWQILIFTVFSFFIIYYLFIAFIPANPSFLQVFFRLIFTLLSLIACLVLLDRLSFGAGSRKYRIPLDTFGVKLYEFYAAIPTLIILLLFVGLTPKRNILSLSIILAILLWPSLFRYLRIEIIREKSKDSFLSVKNLGLGHLRIVFLHILPAAFSALVTPLLFMMIQVVIAESSLSFLGLGISDEIISWGKILAQARLRISAWWLAFFPGLLIFFTLYSLNIVAKRWGK